VNTTTKEAVLYIELIVNMSTPPVF